MKLEVNFLEKPNGEIPSRVKNLNLFLDTKNIIRSKGRLDNCSYFSHEVNDPILLPKGSHLTELYIWYFHDQAKHLGVGTTVNFVRKNGFWIPHIRTVVRKVIHKCILCKKN